MAKTPLERAKTLLAIMQGENAENAEQLLNSLMKKHGFTMADLTGEAKEVKTFIAESNFEVRLLTQIICNTLGLSEIGFKRKSYLDRDNNSIIYHIEIDLTNISFIEISCMFDFYKSRLNQYMDSLFIAFLSKQGLLATAKNGEGNVDIDTILRAHNLAKGIKKETYRKQLE